MFRRRGRSLAPGQRSELLVADISSGRHHRIFTADEVIEAPNWTPDGKSLVFNAGGELWSISSDGGSKPCRIESGAITTFNNDHVLSPDGGTIYASSDDGHIYALPVGGGTPRRVSGDQPHHCYLHGISPDGEVLVYVGVDSQAGQRRADIFSLPVKGGPAHRLTNSHSPHDGPEFSPDGAWIFFNAERASPGHSQLFRMRPDGSGVEQLTFDDRVNWFPHLSPDGLHAVYLSYPPGTQGHPADLDVQLRLMTPDGSDGCFLVSLFGGQGTINVNSWAPDSIRFAYVAYPMAGILEDGEVSF